jgi:F0F1-type ATP synthase membrane subunit a
MQGFVSDPFQRLAEILYSFSNGLVKQQSGIKGLKFFPILFVLFYLNFIFKFNWINSIWVYWNKSSILYFYSWFFDVYWCCINWIVRTESKICKSVYSSNNRTYCTFIGCY